MSRSAQLFPKSYGAMSGISVEARLARLEEEAGASRTSLNETQQKVSEALQALEGQKVAFGDMVAKQLADNGNAISLVVNDARNEFTRVNANLQELHDRTKGAVEQIQRRLSELERNPGAGTKKSQRGYLPMKETIPSVFADKIADWRLWVEDVADFMDDQTEGMKDFLMFVAKEKDPITQEWKSEARVEHDDKVVSNMVNVWRALKKLTSGEARKIVMSVREEDGFRAWQKLHQRFEPGLEAKQGMVLAEFSGMIAKPGKTPADTRGLITEMEERMKLIEDITGKAVDEDHAKSILIGVMDPITRQHTAMNHGVSVTFDKLKNLVLTFANNVRGAEPMQIGRVGELDEHTQDEHDVQSWGMYQPDEGESSLWALGKGGQQCYACHGYGHIARECPVKGKGKGSEGKGSGKGYGGKGQGFAFSSKGYGGKGQGFAFGGKGKGGKGPAKGCWTCGGNHFQSECSVAKGKGKGSARTLGEWVQEADTEHVRVLSTLTVAPLTAQPMCSLSRTSSDSDAGSGRARITSASQITEPQVVAWQQMEPTSVPYNNHVPQSGRVPWSVVEKKQHRNCRKPKQIVINRAQVGTSNTFAIFEDHMPKEMSESVRAFTTIEPEGFNSIETTSEWEYVDMAVDSGATETVVGEEMLECVETKEGIASRRGVQYEVANGIRIPNVGEKKFQGISDEAITRSITAQVCDVNKALLSVKKVVKAGNRVVFDDEEGSYIEDKVTKERMWMKEEQGMYMLRLWVKKGEGF